MWEIYLIQLKRGEAHVKMVVDQPRHDQIVGFKSLTG